MYAKFDIASFFVQMAQHLPDDLKPAALALAEAIEDPRDRSRALLALAPYLSDNLKSEPIRQELAAAGLAEHLEPEAFGATKDVLRSADRTGVPSLLAVRHREPLSAKSYYDALSAVRTIEKGWKRAEVLIALAPGLPKGLIDEAIAIIETIISDRLRLRALVVYIPTLPDHLHAKVLRAVLALESEEDRVDGLLSLAPVLSANQQAEVLIAILTLKRQEHLVRGIAGLLPLISDELKASAISAARRLLNGSVRARVLSAIGFTLSGDKQLRAYGDALSAIRGVDDDNSRLEVILALGTPVPQRLGDKAIAVVREMRLPENRVKALLLLAQGLPEQFRDELILEAFSGARSIGFGELITRRSVRIQRVEVLASLAADLPVQLLTEALRDAFASARALQGGGGCPTKALATFAKHIPGDLKPEMLSLAGALKDGRNRSDVFAAMSLHLPYPLKAEAERRAVDSACTIDNAQDRALALYQLALHFPDDMAVQALECALDAARSISDRMERAWTLVRLAPHLPDALKFRALQDAIADALAVEKHDEMALDLSLEEGSTRTRMRSSQSCECGIGHEEYLGQELEDDQCHFLAEMPTCPAVNQPIEMKVTLSRYHIQQGIGLAAKYGNAKVRAGQDVLIIVRPRANCRIIGSDREVVQMPEGNRVEELIFEVQGERAGPGEIFIEARQGARRLVTLVLQPSFTSAAEPLTSRVAHALFAIAADEPPLVEVHIIEEPLGADQFRLHFLVQCRDLNLNLSERSEPIQRRRERFVEDLYRRLEEFSVRDGRYYERFLARLRDLGADLYVQLVPKSIRCALWQHRAAIGSIEVISEEPCIPWEIAHLVPPDQPVATDRTWFLGELGLVRWLDNLPWAPAQLRVRADRVWSVVPDYPEPHLILASARAEQQVLELLFRARAAPVESLALIDLLRRAGHIDLLHFACHGSADSTSIWNAGLMLQGHMAGGTYVSDPLELSQVKYNAALQHADGRRPIVFLNACQVGRQGYGLTGTGGFADAFLRSGAGLFVGTLWSVGDSSALSFAQAFYQTLKAGANLTAASQAGRAAAKRNQEPTWLAYTVYGHPYARLTEDAPVLPSESEKGHIKA